MKKNIRFLVLWVGTKCTLRCKNCCNLIPYLEQKSYDVDDIISNLNYITKDMNIELLQIQGGEPFTHKYIADIIEKCAINTHVHKIDIASNGTIFPNERTISVIKKYADKISIRFSKYDCVEKLRNDIEKKMNEVYGIDVCEYDFVNETGEWFDLGGICQKKETNKELISQTYKICPNKSCWTLAENYFAGCGRMVSYLKLKHNESIEKSNVLDLLKLREENKNFIEVFQLFEDNYNRYASELCGYCKIGEKPIPAAIQISADELHELMRKGR